MINLSFPEKKGPRGVPNLDTIYSGFETFLSSLGTGGCNKLINVCFNNDLFFGEKLKVCCFFRVKLSNKKKINSDLSVRDQQDFEIEPKVLQKIYL